MAHQRPPGGLARGKIDDFRTVGEGMLLKAEPGNEIRMKEKNPFDSGRSFEYKREEQGL